MGGDHRPRGRGGARPRHQDAPPAGGARLRPLRPLPGGFGGRFLGGFWRLWGVGAGGRGSGFVGVFKAHGGGFGSCWALAEGTAPIPLPNKRHQPPNPPENRPKTAPKTVRKPPPNNNQVCWDGGDLVCCDNCPCAYHPECIGSTLAAMARVGGPGDLSLGGGAAGGSGGGGGCAGGFEYHAPPPPPPSLQPQTLNPYLLAPSKSPNLPPPFKRRPAGPAPTTPATRAAATPPRRGAC